MRDQFYADANDVWKWTCVVKAAVPDKRILYVVMYRPDAPKSFRARFYPADEISSRVAGFFDEEQPALNRDRRVARITRLDKRIELIDSEYRHEIREDYFAEVVRRLSRPRSTSFVVLLDPDTGMESNHPGDKHVCCAQIRSTWKHMNRGDVLLVYQECQIPAAFSGKQLKIEQAVGMSVRSLQHEALPRVRIFRADK